MLNQTVLMEQLLKILVALPTNGDFVQLLESVRAQSAGHSSGMDVIYQILAAIHQHLIPDERQTDPLPPTPLYSDHGQASPRPRSRTPGRSRDEAVGDVAASPAQCSPPGDEPDKDEDADARTPEHMSKEEIELQQTLKLDASSPDLKDVTPSHQACQSPCEDVLISELPRAIRPFKATK